MKKLMIMMVVAAGAACAWAGPRGCGGGCGPGGSRPCGPCGPRPCGPGWGCRPCGPGWGRCPPPPPPCHRGWGRGGCNFWPGFVGGVVGGIVGNAIASPSYYSTSSVVVSQPVVTSPVVVQQPVIVQQPVQTVVSQPSRVWVEGRYVDQVQANGTVVRVWQAGHYE